MTEDQLRKARSTSHRIRLIEEQIDQWKKVEMVGKPLVEDSCYGTRDYAPHLGVPAAGLTSVAIAIEALRASAVDNLNAQLERARAEFKAL